MPLVLQHFFHFFHIGSSSFFSKFIITLVLSIYAKIFSASFLIVSHYAISDKYDLLYRMLCVYANQNSCCINSGMHAVQCFIIPISNFASENMNIFIHFEYHLNMKVTLNNFAFLQNLIFHVVQTMACKFMQMF